MKMPFSRPKGRLAIAASLLIVIVVVAIISNTSSSAGPAAPDASASVLDRISFAVRGFGLGGPNVLASDRSDVDQMLYQSIAAYRALAAKTAPRDGWTKILVRGSSRATRFALFRDVGAQLGFRIELQSSKDDRGGIRTAPSRDYVGVMCIEITADECIAPSEYSRFNFVQRVSKIRGLIGVTYGKDAFCRTMMNALDGFSPKRSIAVTNDVNQLDFVFPCYILPMDMTALSTDNAAGRWAADQRWIVKPVDGQGGSGITVSDSLADLLRDTENKNSLAVVQPLLDPPLLIDGYKFDLRVYALVTSITPLRLYIHDMGLVRFAAEPYSTGGDNSSSSSGVGRKTQFLTNTSINTSLKDMIDLLWPFSQFAEYLTSLGHDAAAVFKRIHSAIVRVFLAAEAALHSPTMFDNSHNYMLFGVDVILDPSLAPRVIEINRNPSMDRDGPAGSWYVEMKEKIARDLLRTVFGSGQCGGQLYRQLKDIGVIFVGPQSEAAGTLPAECVEGSSERWRCLTDADVRFLFEAKCERERCSRYFRGGDCLFRPAYPASDADRYTEWLHHLDSKIDPASSARHNSWPLHRIHTAILQMEDATDSATTAAK